MENKKKIFFILFHPVILLLLILKNAVHDKKNPHSYTTPVKMKEKKKKCQKMSWKIL